MESPEEEILKWANFINPELVAQAYSLDSRCRNRPEFFTGRQAIIEFLKRKWAKELPILEAHIVQKSINI